MKRQRPKSWTTERERIFLEHAGKIGDHALAKMVGTHEKWVRALRKEFGIQKFTNRKYTDEQIAYIEAHYKERSVSEMISVLSKMYPETTFTIDGIKDRMLRYGLIRTKEQASAIRSREATLPGAKERFAKIAQSCTKQKPGDVYWSNWYKEWLIQIDNKSHKFYKVYVWEQHNPKLPQSHYIRLKDPTKPITIDNLEMVKKDCSRVAIDLTDNWVIHTMMHGKDETHREFLKANPVLIQQQRKKIELIREIKAIENEYKQLAPTPKTDEGRLL